MDIGSWTKARFNSKMAFKFILPVSVKIATDESAELRLEEYSCIETQEKIEQFSIKK